MPAEHGYAIIGSGCRSHLLPVTHHAAPLQKNMMILAVMAAQKASEASAIVKWSTLVIEKGSSLTYCYSSELTSKGLLLPAIQRLWGRGMQVWLVGLNSRRIAPAASASSGWQLQRELIMIKSRMRACYQHLASHDVLFDAPCRRKRGPVLASEFRSRSLEVKSSEQV